MISVASESLSILITSLRSASYPAVTAPLSMCSRACLRSVATSVSAASFGMSKSFVGKYEMDAARLSRGTSTGASAASARAMGGLRAARIHAGDHLDALAGLQGPHCRFVEDIARTIADADCDFEPTCAPFTRTGAPRPSPCFHGLRRRAR